MATPLLTLVTVAALAAAAPQSALEFEPRVGSPGSRIVLKTPPPVGATVRFGTHKLTPTREDGKIIVLVPVGAQTAFLEFVVQGKPVAKSAVPFVVSGGVGAPPKLIGLKEAIDVFGYSESRPEGGERPESKSVLKLDEDAIFTIGEPPPAFFGPAVELGDAASAATRGMGQPGFLLTARPPKKKLPEPTPGPSK